MTRMRITRRSAVLAGAVGAAGRAWGQSSTRPVSIVHGFTPGANVDVVARLIADQLSPRLGRKIIVEPRPGAGGTIAAASVARAVPDGSTLTVLPGGHAVSAAIYKKLSYDAVADFSFIGMLTDFPFILVTYPDHPAKSVADVIRLSRAEASQLTCATAGNGTGMHLAFELFVATAKARIQHVAYRGSPQAITDLMGKRIDFQIDTPAALMPLIRDGQLRAIAVTGADEFFMLPGVEPIGSTVPGYVVTSWLGVAGPAGLPDAEVVQLNAHLRAILATPAVVDQLRHLGSDVRPTSPAEFRDKVASDITKWSKVVADAKIERV